MANFVVIVDPDADRRRQFLQRVREKIAPVDGLQIESFGVGNFAVVWATYDRATVSSIWSTTSAAVIWGDAIPGPGPERLDAAGLADAWKPDKTVPPSFDGFYAALRYDVHQGLTAGCDLLGFFPVYYATSSDTLLLGASPELFTYHPAFPPKVSLEGLTGILLTHAVFEGRALLSGVRRLRQGHILVWSARSRPREIVQYTLPASPRAEAGSFESDVDELNSVLADAIDRHVPRDGTQGLLLSGGRDSRLLAGYLHERGDRMHALTLGSSSDYEMISARAVAGALGCVHQTMELDDAILPANARLQAKWEHLGSGFSSVHMWGAIAPLRELPSRFVSGYNMESRSGERKPFDGQGLLTGAMRRGIAISQLDRLLRAEVFDGIVDEMRQRLSDVYNASSEIEAERPWRFLMAHDWRAHAGGVPWKLSFGSWPILPILDRKVIAAIATLPASTLANRRAQDAILRQQFPALARLPLDRNSHDTLSLLPSSAERARHSIARVMEPVTSRFRRRRERRYYHRVYDIDGPGWRAVRQRAERHRERLADLFNMDVLAEMVPPPDTRVDAADKVRDSFGMKQLIGFMLWSGRHVS